MFNDVVHCTTRPLRLFAGHESQLTPLGPSNRPPTVGIRRTFAHRRVDQTQWRSSEGQFFEHPSIFIQTIHLKRKKKTKVPFSSPKLLFFCFWSGGQKKVRLGKNQSKKGGKKGTSDVSGFKNLVYSELPWFVPTRLPSQFHHDAFHDLENGAKKKTACLFVQNGPVSEKDRDLVGFVWVSFTNPSKKDTITKTFCSCSCIRTLERKSASLAETICRQGMVPSPESIHSSVKQVQVFWCSGTFENTTNKNGWLVTEAACCSSSLSSLLQPYRCSRERSDTPSVWSSCLAPFLRSVRAHLGGSSKKQRPAPKKRVGFSVTSENQRVEEKLQGTLNSGTPNSYTLED